MKRIGRYDVVSTLGEGGMGTVYEVTLPGGTERLALKVLKDAAPEVVERFGREAAILQFLGRHDHVVGFRELGEERGRPYLVMELVRGGTLASLLKEGRADSARVIALPSGQ
ncbi:protein kinase [bacterium]|nr:protein kinase [bacterium]